MGRYPECTPFNMVLGGGAAVKAKDSSLIAHPRLKRLMVDVAERGASRNASWRCWSAAAPTPGRCSSPGRRARRNHLHRAATSRTPCEMVDIGDVEACVSLLAAVVDELESPSGGGIL